MAPNMRSESKSKKALKWLIAASVRLNVASGGSAGPTENALADTAVRIRRKEITTTRGMATQLVQEHAVIPTDEVFQHQFSGLRLTSPATARFYLRALEEAFVGTDGIYVLSDSEDDLNLEHILPVNGRGDAWSHVPDEQANTLCRRLGNMVLLSPRVNAKLESKGFADKVKAYKESANTRLTQELAKQYANQVWGEQQISTWQEQLAKLAVKAWDINAR
jgi:hypothetical protein